LAGVIKRQPNAVCCCVGGGWAVSRIVVIDVDPRHGGDEALKKLEAKVEELPTTPRFLTGGGGEHYLFRHPGGYIPNSASGALGQGIDVRGDGGFVVAPPSLHICGRRYAIDVDRHPDDVPIAPLPEWLHERLIAAHRQQQLHEKPVRPSAGLSRYGEVALDNACRRILAAGDGAQETTLNRESYSIGRLAGAGALPPEFARRVLLHVASRLASYDEHRPWQTRQLTKKLERAFGDGLRNPRRVRR
jgi:bifunctional DNA primase/polymerase-like protein